jgi:hypothetical protein
MNAEPANTRFQMADQPRRPGYRWRSSIYDMTQRTKELHIGRDGLESFILCLALGTFEAMRSKAWTAEAGIWTLGRPTFKSLLEISHFPKDVIEVIEQADELAAIQELVADPKELKLTDFRDF